MSEPVSSSWLSGRGEYAKQVNALCASDPRLSHRDPKNIKQKVPWPHRHCRVVSLQASANGPFEPSRPIPTVQHLRTQLEAKPNSNDERRIFIVEAPSPEYIDAVGSQYQMCPSFFTEHLSTVVFDNSTNALSDAPVLPSVAMTREHVTIPYFELCSIPNSIQNTFKLYCAVTGRHLGVTRYMGKFSNAGTLRRKCSIWKRDRPSGKGWDCVILTDPPLLRVGKGPNEAAVTLQNPPSTFQGGYMDFIPRSEWSVPQAAHGSGLSHEKARSTYRQGPPRTSMLEDICFYLEVHGKSFNLEDPASITLIVSKIIASQYLKQADYLGAVISQYQWQMSRQERLSITIAEVEGQWSDSQALDRRMSEYCESLGWAMMQLSVPFEEADPRSAKDWRDINVDYQFLYKRFQDTRHRAEQLSSLITGLASMAGNRQSVFEAKSTKTLTVLGLVFIPLAYTASLFSMAEPYAPGSELFWVYFAISVPLIALLMAIYYVVDKRRDGSLSKWLKKDGSYLPRH